MIVERHIVPIETSSLSLVRRPLWQATHSSEVLKSAAASRESGGACGSDCAEEPAENAAMSQNATAAMRVLVISRSRRDYRRTSPTGSTSPPACAAGHGR